MCKEIVLKDRCLTLAVAIVSMYFEMRNDLPSALRSQMEKAMGVTGMLQATARVAVELRLAQTGEQKLLELLARMAASSLLCTARAEAFEKSVSVAQWVGQIEYDIADPENGFVLH